MKLKYYGTAAAEGVPGLFCTCETCEKSKKAGGRNLRTRSQAMINDKLMIDFPPDTLMHVYTYGLNILDVENIIITHKHADHLLSNDFNQRNPGYATLKEEKPIRVFGSQCTIEALEPLAAVKSKRIELHAIKPFETMVLDGIEVTPLRALHDMTIDPYIYDLKQGDKRMLYAHDTGYFLDEVWQYMKENNVKYNLVSLDCTYVKLYDRNNHMGIETISEVRERMITENIADEKTIFIAQHFSHNGGATYDEFVPIAAEKGFLVSYDTMEVKF